MRLRTTFLWMLAVVVMATGISGSAAEEAPQRLQMYTAIVEPVEAEELARGGYGIAAKRTTARGVELDLVLPPAEASRLEDRGIDLVLWRNSEGFTATELAARQAEDGFLVWRSWDEPGGIRDELYQIAEEHPDIVDLQVLGETWSGRELIALKVTKDARTTPDGSRPAVLYQSLQHAREWISVEVNRRLLHHLVDNYGSDNGVTELVDTRELWFVIVANPDGYQYTFDVDRLWRKNLRDNDGDGEITIVDGVDPNRNFEEHWGYDEEGSSSLPSSEVYRGPGPASEPETVFTQGLLDRLGFAFMVNYHSYGQLLLYTFGWQIQTFSADNPIYLALSGTDEEPAIEGYDPDLGAELYITNGETTDYAHARSDTLAWTPELGEGIPGNGFLFPDDEALIQREFEINLPFALDLAKSAADPDDPISHLGNTTEPFYLHQEREDLSTRENPLTDFRFEFSYGDPQPVRVLAARSLGPVTLRYRINGGPWQSAPTTEWQGGDRFGAPGDVYYRIVEGTVEGTSPGDTVKVVFQGGGQQSEGFTYTVASDSGADVLIMAAEDYTGISPVYSDQSGPNFIDFYTDALEANGIAYDVYDVDARGREAPDDLGVLNHFEAVIWYTGNDIITRAPTMLPGTASRLANEEMLEVRSFMNEAGDLLYTGKYAGFQYAFAYEYNPVNNRRCNTANPDDGCLPLSDDFQQYYLGALLYNDDAGTSPSGELYDVDGTDVPFEGLSWSFGGPDSADNQDHSASFLATGGFLPPDEFPQFLSWASAEYDRPGGPFDPHTGEQYMYSQIADVSYKRLTRTIDLEGETSATLSLWTSYDTEPDWDYLFVEARTVGGDDWTTLPDQNGHTGTDTGESCPEGWFELHPHLEHYQTLNDEGTCSPTGTTGEWNAASGNSGGWEQWTVDLSAWAGEDVEVSVAYASDWATQGLGVFIDDIEVSTGEGSTSFEEDDDPMDGWEVTGPPEGSGPNANNWVRITSEAFPEGAAISTPDSIFFGFGFEGISGSETRAEVMERVAQHLMA
jgi:Zinc carboxypeptidase/Immune inhibitor A peptidase M6